MRRVVIGLTILILVLIVAVVVAIFNVNTYLEENRETLTGLASDAVGREVSFEAAEVAFSSGLAVRVVGLRIAEDPRFGPLDFLRLEEAYLGLRILPALQRRIEVSGIRFDAPTIRIVQTAEGFNFSALVGQGEAPPNEPSPAEEGAPLAVAIALLEITGGTIHFEDRTSSEGLSLVIDGFETSGTDLALEGPIAIGFSGRARSAKAAETGLASRLEGEIRLGSLDPLEGTLRLQSPTFHPAIFGVRFEEGAAVERIDSLEIDVVLAANPAKSGVPVRVRSQNARLAGFDLDSIAVDLVYHDTARGSRGKMDQVAIALAGGSVDLTGEVVLGEPDASPFDLMTKIQNLDSGELAAALLGWPPGMLSGRLGGELALRGDSLEWESLKRSLAGSLRFEIGEGALEQVNVLNSLVGRLVADPGLGQLAAHSIRDVAPNALAGDRTPFETIDMALEIAEGAITARDLSLEAGDFAIQAVGTLGLDGSIAAEGTIRFSQDLSQKILAKADWFAAILADGEIVTLPLRFGGTTDAPSLMPDLAALSQMATASAKKEVTDRVTKKLGDAIFGRNHRTPEGDAAGEADRDSAEDLLKEGLGRLLGR